MSIQLLQQRNLYRYNVKDFGAVGDGLTDDSIPISAANSMASGVGGEGGVVSFPPGVFITGKQMIYTGIHWEGSGITSTIIKLMDNTNDDLFQGSVNGYINGQNGYAGSTKMIDLYSPQGTGVGNGSRTTTLYDFSFKDMTVDGNRANQSGTSNCFRFYGYGYTFEDINIRNGLSGGIVSDYNGGSSLFSQGVAPGDMSEARFTNVKIHNNGGIGFQMGGPHDSQFSNVISFFNDSHSFHFAPNAGGMQLVNCHAFGVKQHTNSVGILVESGNCQFVGCDSEGSDTAQLVFLSSSNVWSGGNLYMAGTVTVTSTGLQLGQVASKTLATAQTASPLTLAFQPSSAAPNSYLQFIITGASAPGSLIITGIGLSDVAQTETVTATGNGTFLSTKGYIAITSITVTGLTGYSINVLAIPVPYAGSAFQSGGLPTAVFAAGNIVDTAIQHCEGYAGAVAFLYDAGNNIIEANVYNTGGFLMGGSPSPLSHMKIVGNSQTPDGSTAKGGGIQYAVNSFNAFKITDRTLNLFNINTTSKRVSHLNGMADYYFTDDAITEVMRIANDANGSLYWHAGDTSLQWRATGVMKFSGALCIGTSASAAVIATGGTITTNSVGLARVSPTSDVTGVILQQAQINGQECWVINESSSFSITMAASGTSLVSEGTACVIPPLMGKKFIYETGTNLWYSSGRDIFNEGHIVVNTGTTPTVAVAGGVGTSPPTPTVTGTDTRGNVLFGTGTATGAGTQIAVTFAKAYASTPVVIVCATNLLTGALTVYAASATTTGFNISTVTAPAASQAAGTYSVNYQVMG